MVEHESQWHTFKNPSTFTFPGRNAVATQEIGEILQKEGHGSIKTIAVVGSGPIEPFVTAALSIASEARILAVDPDQNVSGLVTDLKRGQRISWIDIEKVCRNGPDNSNNDLSGDRLARSIKRLNWLGVGQKLHADMQGLQVDKRIGDRVELIESDGLSFFNDAPPYSDLIIEAFVRANINKLDGGKQYSDKLLQLSLKGLKQDGVFLIGDTGLNLPITLEQFSQSQASLLSISLAHAIHYLRGRFITSHYIAAGERAPFINYFELIQVATKRLSENKLLKELKIRDLTSSKNGLQEVSKDHLLLGFVGTKKGLGKGWISELKNLANILPPRGELNPDVVFTRQKVELPSEEITIFPN